DRDFSSPGVVVAPELHSALESARGDALRRGTDEIVVIGGAEIYTQTLPIADRLDLTLVKASPEGNIRFPTIDPEVWRESERSEQKAGPDDATDFAFVTYDRVAPVAAQT